MRWSPSIWRAATAPKPSTSLAARGPASCRASRSPVECGASIRRCVRWWRTRSLDRALEAAGRVSARVPPLEPTDLTLLLEGTALQPNLLVAFDGAVTSCGARRAPAADGDRLEVTDILALERAPNQVILSACEGARDEYSEVATLGLAQAFVVAGSS